MAGERINHDPIECLHRLVPILERDENIVFAYLFGSLARGEQTNRSDIDLAVYCRDLSARPEYRLDLIGRLTAVAGTMAIDLVLLNTAALSLTGRVLRDHQVLVDREPTLRHSFESLKLREFWDFQHIENRILEGRFGLGRS